MLRCMLHDSLSCTSDILCLIIIFFSFQGCKDAIVQSLVSYDYDSFVVCFDTVDSRPMPLFIKTTH